MRRLNQQEQLKMLFIIVVGVLLWYANVYQYSKVVSAAAILGNIIASFIMSFGLGVIIFLIVRIFRKPKTQKSIFRRGVDYGFFVSIFLALLVIGDLLNLA